jgi:hypothetical protein
MIEVEAMEMELPMGTAGAMETEPFMESREPTGAMEVI